MLSVRASLLYRFTALDLAMMHDHTSCMDLLIQHHAPSGGGKFHEAAVRIQDAWRLHKKKVCN